MADNMNDPMSCAEMAQEITNSSYTQTAADVAAAAVALAGPGQGIVGMAGNLSAAHDIQQYGPEAAGAVFHGACLPIEAAQEAGHAIGTYLHDTFASHTNPTPDVATHQAGFGHSDTPGHAESHGSDHHDATGGHVDHGSTHDSGAHDGSAHGGGTGGI